MIAEKKTFYERISSSQFIRLLLVVFLILVLQIPTVMLQSLVADRQSVRQEAITDITSKWGKQQTIIGPKLILPYIKRTQIGKTLKEERLRIIYLPKDLQITGNIDAEKRYRGIFEVPVYSTQLNIQGSFLRPDLSNQGVQEKDILWDKAELQLQISDVRAIQNQAVLTWNNAKIPFQPGSQGQINSSNSGIFAPLRGQTQGNTFNFTIPLKLNGSERLAFAPFGEVTKVKLTSDWQDPSFQGLWLPNQRTVSANGFEASWEIPSLGRNYPQQLTENADITDSLIMESIFGVDLISPIDNYRMAERSIKYNFLFILLTFATLWLFEVTARLRVHPLQYLLVGAAMCMFYLLQLALSEHIGFSIAYLIASLAVVILITTYCFAILKAKRRGGIIGVVEVVLYGYLYFVLINQDYALLLGSFGLFGFLAIIMYFTRRIDWYNSNSQEGSD